MGNLLRYRVVQPDIADRLLAIAVENRSSLESGIHDRLIDALRADNPDVRARLQIALLYLANAKNVCVGESLLNWKPSKDDSSTQIDQRIKDWQTFWSKGASPAPCPEAVKRSQPTESVKPTASQR
jgi:hypothetical protein